MSFPDVLPDKFEFKNSIDKILTLAKIDASNWYLTHDDGSTDYVHDGDVQYAISKGLWTFLKDLTEKPVSNIPDHFTFNHEHTSQVYEMKRMGRDWECTKDGQGWGAYYTAEEIEQHIKERSWQNIKPVGSVEAIKEEEPVEQLKEPGLIFPFTFVVPEFAKEGPLGSIDNPIYTVTDAGNGQIKLVSAAGVGGGTKSGAEDNIRKGLWVVKSVGEQPAQKEPADAAEERYEPLPELCKQLIEWKHCMSYNDSYFGEPEGLLKKVVYQMDREIQKQPEEVISTLAVKLDSSEVIASIDTMTEAIHNLADAYERLARAKEEVGSV